MFDTDYREDDRVIRHSEFGEVFFDRSDKRKSKKHFQKIGENKGKNAGLQGNNPTDGLTGLLIEENVPGSTEQIAEQKSEQHGKNKDPFVMRKERGEKPHGKRKKEKSRDISARDAEQLSDTAGKSRKNGKSDCPEKNVYQNRKCSTFSTQKANGAEDAEGLHGDGKCHNRKGNPGTDSHKCRGQGNVGKIQKTGMDRTRIILHAEVLSNGNMLWILWSRRPYEGNRGEHENSIAYPPPIVNLLREKIVTIQNKKDISASRAKEEEAKKG